MENQQNDKPKELVESKDQKLKVIEYEIDMNLENIEKIKIWLGNLKYSISTLKNKDDTVC